MTRQVTPLPCKELPVATGNWDPTRKPIDRVILHTMVGTTTSAAARFNTPNQAAAHYGISLDGSVVHWVDEDNTAYHAGDYLMNQRSIGIEHEDNGEYNGVRTNALYTTSAKLVKDICNFYNIPIDRDHIKKHSEVSDNPTGCPDALDVDRIVREASGTISPPTTDMTDDEKRALDVLKAAQTEFKYGTLEGAARGLTGDERDFRGYQLTNKEQAKELDSKTTIIEDQQIEISKLQEQLQNAQTSPSGSTNSGPITVDDQNIIIKFVNYLKRLWL